MNFSVTCKSIKEFDAESGKYIRCGHVVPVTSAQVGTLVRCPECDNDIEVPNPSMLSSVNETLESASSTLASQPAATNLPTEVPHTDPTDSPELSSGAPAPASSERPPANPVHDEQAENPAVASQAPLVSQLKAPVSDQRTSESSARRTRAPESPAAEATPNPTNAAAELQPSVGTQAPEFDLGVSTNLPTEVGELQLKKESVNDIQTPTLSHATFSRDNSCHKCGTLLAEKQAECPNCRSPRRAAFVDKKDRKAISKKGPFGFQLWLSSISMGPPKTGEVNYFAIMSYMVAVLLMGAGIAFIIFAGITGIFVGLFVAFGGFCLFTGTRYADQTRENPRVPMPLIGKMAWSVILYFLRQSKFQKFSDAAVLDKRDDGSAFSDRDLAAIRDLNKFKVIDLEGTDITDAGLLYLYDLRGIHYLVVRNTKVTDDAVHDLHQTIPKTWIWY